MRCLRTAEISCHKTWNQQVTKRHVTTPTRKYLFKPNHAAICECSQGRLRNETFVLVPTDNKTFELQQPSQHGCGKTRQSPLKFHIHKRFGHSLHTPFYVLMNSMYRTGGRQEILARKLAPQTGYRNAKVPKATISFMSVRPSVRPQGTTPLPLEGF
jgi:hypothetical protein